MRRARFASLSGCNHMTALLRVDLIMPQVLDFLSEPAQPSDAAIRHGAATQT
jgi:hypothetical protein